MKINPFSNYLAEQLQAMRGKMEAAQDGLAQKTIEASDDCSIVKITMTGHQEVIAVSLNILEPGNFFDGLKGLDVEILQDAITDAVNRATAKSKEMAAQEISEIAQASMRGL